MGTRETGVHKHSRKRLGTIFVLVVALVATTAAPAAARFNSGGMWTAQYTFYRGSYNTTWGSPMATAESRWNPAPEVDIIRQTGTSGTSGSVYAAQYAGDWYGYAVVSNGTSFTIQLNSRTIAANASNIGNFIQSVYVHEFGHTFYLADNPGTTLSSIMKESRNRNTMVAPSAYDFESVQIAY
jgi:hypothetical protein